MIVVKNAGHGFTPVHGPVSPKLVEITRAMTDFFGEYPQGKETIKPEFVSVPTATAYYRTVFLARCDWSTRSDSFRFHYPRDGTRTEKASRISKGTILSANIIPG